MQKVVIIIASLFIISCTNNSAETEVRNDSPVVIMPDANDVAQNNTEINAEGCYRKILARDTMIVNLNQVDTMVTGNMVFDNFEKDGSRGTVRGVVDGQIIKLWYDFQSEGMNSVMEMWFRKEGNKLIRGIGSFGVKGDTSYYTNPADIKYDTAQAFDKIKCAF